MDLGALEDLLKRTEETFRAREQLGQAMKLIPRERKRKDLRISKPTLTSSTGSAAREDRKSVV